MVTIQLLSVVFPLAKLERIEEFFIPLDTTMSEFQINTPLRVAAFLAQIGHESGQLKYVKELWGPTEQQLKYEPPSALATTLGNLFTGDGFAYRGRGLIQVTGRMNYRACGRALLIDLEGDPELLEIPMNACRSAGWYWQSHGINVPADMGDFKRVTKLVNGGYNGIIDREILYRRALNELGVGS